MNTLKTVQDFVIIGSIGNGYESIDTFPHYTDIALRADDAFVAATQGGVYRNDCCVTIAIANTYRKTRLALLQFGI